MENSYHIRLSLFPNLSKLLQTLGLGHLIQLKVE